MILLDSKEILAAISRSLETHVLPRLEDDFARVQVISAVAALVEVTDRLENGDPCEQLNADMEAGARAIAEQTSGEYPDFANALRQALTGLPDESGPRERNCQLGEALWSLVSDRNDPPVEKLLALLHEQALVAAGGDAKYICGDAIASLA